MFDKIGGYGYIDARIKSMSIYIKFLKIGRR
jgi:hypothetical protein